MKFILIVACLALYVAHNLAQDPDPDTDPSPSPSPRPRPRPRTTTRPTSRPDPEIGIGECLGAPNRTSCTGSMNKGHSRFRRCRLNANDEMWYYDSTSRSCKEMSYRGCGGNRNRYCTRSNCRRKCRRSST